VYYLWLYRTQNVTIDSKAFADLPVPTLKSNTTVGTNNNATMTIHTTNSIQGSNFNVLKQEEPVIPDLKVVDPTTTMPDHFSLQLQALTTLPL